MNLPEPTTDPVEFDCRLHEISEKVSGWPRGEAYCCLESYKFACYKLLIEQSRKVIAPEVTEPFEPWVAGADADVADYNVKAPFLRSKGWDTWYNNDYWVHPKITPQGADYTYYGWDTDRAYKFEMSLIKEAQLARKE